MDITYNQNFIVSQNKTAKVSLEILSDLEDDWDIEKVLCGIVSCLLGLGCCETAIGQEFERVGKLLVTKEYDRSLRVIKENEPRA